MKFKLQCSVLYRFAYTADDDRWIGVVETSNFKNCCGFFLSYICPTATPLYSENTNNMVELQHETLNRKEAICLVSVRKHF